MIFGIFRKSSGRFDQDIQRGEALPPVLVCMNGAMSPGLRAAAGTYTQPGYRSQSAQRRRGRRVLFCLCVSAHSAINDPAATGKGASRECTAARSGRARGPTNTYPSDGNCRPPSDRAMPRSARGGASSHRFDLLQSADWITRRERTRHGRDRRVHRNPATLVTPTVRYPSLNPSRDQQPPEGET